MIITSDLHIHSRYSAATSPRMDLHTLAKEASRKGIQLLGTGDCLHPQWLHSIRELEECGGLFAFRDEKEGENTHFVLTVEVEDERRVHHLLIVPSIAKAQELYEALSTHSPDIDTDGRPTLRMSGQEIADHARDAEALLGPCHAFTPWTALYAYHNSLNECYGDMARYVSFVELGLSADTSYADRIGELKELTFLSNSDAHSPYPTRLAREFNRFHVKDMSFIELKAAIERKRGRKPILNIGFPPEEGKYNESACIRCYTHYSLNEAIIRKWRCECGGIIKKGVRDRVNELANCDCTHPEHRPPYLHVIPLAEIIGLALGKSANAKAVNEMWDALLTEFGTEVTVLVDATLDEFHAATVDERVIEAIKAFRNGEIQIMPGGGGKYGVIMLKPRGGEEKREKDVLEGAEGSKKGQLSLLDF
jgi:uncharacterized protein (TIGR00375 family)